MSNFMEKVMSFQKFFVLLLPESNINGYGNRRIISDF